MNPAVAPRARRSAARLLHVDAALEHISDRAVPDLAQLLAPGDLLVFNDAATLPAALSGHAGDPAQPIELRLLADAGEGAWQAVLFGAGDFRTPTEHRPPPPRLPPGTRLSFEGLTATLEAALSPSPRLVRVRFNCQGAAFWSALYRAGRPVQYSYVPAPLELWDVQTLYAGRPWAVEAPSAGHAFDAELLLALRRRGVDFASVTHAAGLSATGDPLLDAALPLPERFFISERTVAAVTRARAAKRAVIAVGTSVVRALESRALERGVSLGAGESTTALRIGPGYVPRVVDGLFTGIHDPAESHYALLQAFAPRTLLSRALTQARASGYLGHEFGDACFIRAGHARPGLGS